MRGRTLELVALRLYSYCKRNRRAGSSMTGGRLRRSPLNDVALLDPLVARLL